MAFPVAQRWLLAALILAGLASAVSSSIDPYFLDVVMGVGVSVVLASSLNLINGFTGQFSLGHAGFMAVGAYTSAMLSTVVAPRLGWNPVLLQWVFFPMNLIAAGLLAAVAGLAVGAPSLRLKGDYLAIVTLGFGEIIRVVLQNMDMVGGARGLTGVPAYSNLFWTFGTAALTVYTVWALLNSTHGRGFLAVADDEVAAEAMGLDTTRYKITAFGIGSFFAGVAGGLYAHLKGYLNPGGFSFDKSIEIVVMVILGGMGRHAGVVFAAILLTLLPEGLRELGSRSVPNPFGGAPWSLDWIKEMRMILYSLMLILLMLMRPQGLFHRSERRRRGA